MGKGPFIKGTKCNRILLSFHDRRLLRFKGSRFKVQYEWMDVPMYVYGPTL